MSDWLLAIVLAVAGVPTGYLLNRVADDELRRRDGGERRGGRAIAVAVAIPLLFAACALKFGVHARTAVAVGFVAVLVVISAIDLELRIVPNRIVVPAAAVALAAQTAIDPSAEWAIAAFAAAAFFLIAALAYPGGMGMGDVKLALLLGAALGRAVAAAVAIALVASLVPSVVILARHGSRGRKMGIPFAPFLALGGVVALFAGRWLVDQYLRV